MSYYDRKRSLIPQTTSPTSQLTMVDLDLVMGQDLQGLLLEQEELILNEEKWKEREQKGSIWLNYL